uniref:Uncharacterized protein n=1 Tax=Chromera velia CCMP2878 TaxID=1169474 RepID=A0A0G4GC58_9ALVE|mmetsp:Transcript_30246/g.59399  ORF Transcript_30246/g.59399 Transcript_30246/m.59399 type:complete len:291 (+) Transcript_30246:138-1010(+)|eukprot:Cvel_4496.t1-p1 / transcript=Cvel_4496.t1 / gene=Cvel_4496 / organism=Chromera_velia_CCMP2878 / gene_product=Ankyrin-3, putative / transcript_product=Ankyrin-3, putative / location=Cvel_scaffold197:6956-8163(+) / protein_length=290 / sequence_SO=supercontig / SO=protein_coding / is_pseudo=false
MPVFSKPVVASLCALAAFCFQESLSAPAPLSFSSVRRLQEEAAEETADAPAEEETEEIEETPRRPVFTTLFQAAAVGNIDGIYELLENGEDVNAVELVTNYTALYFAAGAGHTEAMAALIGEGADVNVEAFRTKFTPLHNAAWHGQAAATKELLDNDAAVDALDNEQWTPLHLAAFGAEPYDADASIETIQALIDGGANVTALTDEGRNALHYAAQRNRGEVAAFLLEQAPEMAVVMDAGGQTPLELATSEGSTEAVAVLEAAQPAEEEQTEEAEAPAEAEEETPEGEAR